MFVTLFWRHRSVECLPTTDYIPIRIHGKVVDLILLLVISSELSSNFVFYVISFKIIFVMIT